MWAFLSASGYPKEAKYCENKHVWIATGDENVYIKFQCKLRNPQHNVEKMSLQLYGAL